MNKLVLTTASAVLIAMAGMASAAEPSTSGNLNSPQTSASAPATQSSSAMTSPVNPSEDQIKAAQQQLKTAGDYKGSRSEEHTSELQSHSFISYAVFCL